MSIPLDYALSFIGAQIHDVFGLDDGACSGRVICFVYRGELLFHCHVWEDERRGEYELSNSRPLTDSDIEWFGNWGIRGSVPYHQLGPELRRLRLDKCNRTNVLVWLRKLPALKAYKARAAAKKMLQSAGLR